MAIQRRAIICAGHGGGDSGAVGQGTTEAAETIDIANRVVRMLREAGGIEVHLVPHELNYIPSIQWVNARWKGVEDAIAIEIHKNSGGGTGSEVWTPSHPDSTALAFSQTITNAIAKATGQPNRGVKQAQNNRWGRLAWCDDTNTYACLIEAGFIDRDPVGRDANEKYARGIAAGILGYFGITPAPKPAPAPLKPAPQPSNANIVYEKLPQPKEVIINKDTNLWNFNFARWGDAKAVRPYKAGHPVTVVAIAHNKSVSADYYMTSYSYNEGKIMATHGFNVKDCTDKPATPPPVPAPIPKAPEQPKPAPAPKPSDVLVNNQDLEKRVSALEKAVTMIKEFLAKVFKLFNK